MKKPEKRKLDKESIYLQYDKGYNHCYSEWEVYLPNEEEIIDILNAAYIADVYTEDTLLSNKDVTVLAKAIHKRIKGE